MPRRLAVAAETFPIAGRFTIARGSRTEAVVVTVAIESEGRLGRGECVPYPRYGETVESVVRQIESARSAVSEGADRTALAALLPPGAGRNALDCALWDLEAKTAGVAAHVLAGIDRLGPVTTCYTISLDTPEAMAEAARKAADRPILKVKLGGLMHDPERIAAVRAAAPEATLVVDANEGWSEDTIAANLAACAAAGVALVEQPLPADRDAALAGLSRSIPICADESVHDRASLPRVADLYDAINIKLDKTGGLTEALALVEEATVRGLSIMVGCMVGTSLAMAPAMLLTPRARFVDLDGPLLLAEDRPGGLTYEGSIVYPPTPSLWG
ncbi:dipeptide epimerase [Chelatococcus sp. SYSU_G07232]|uniref:Dipeptide epimerase n=1 Tax=Chelatococcus albus TaxID=3047466 RepID=A0ABT7AHE4_9HYPH|nr:N-acetyl-D-Glu racemase DgcA [Chelatococcus sp. SYSU_G07232]MDJ1158500.1 dipeptide epimerase [Chelatococcus sp. SYSU_G07232]